MTATTPPLTNYEYWNQPEMKALKILKIDIDPADCERLSAQQIFLMGYRLAHLESLCRLPAEFHFDMLKNLEPKAREMCAHFGRQIIVASTEVIRAGSTEQWVTLEVAAKTG